MRTLLRTVCWALLLHSVVAAAQNYPEKAVTMVAPFPAGGSVDLVARAVAQQMSEIWKQPVIVSNRPGASGVIGVETVVRSAADGYTLLMGTIGGLAVSMSLLPNRGFDTLRDFAPITQAVNVTNFLVVHPSVPAKSVKELLAMARARPGGLNYASSGNGTVTHLAGELLKLMGKVDIVHVPYKGGAPALTALLSGETDMSYENSLIILPQIKAGRVKALAVTGAKRSPLLPQLPAIGETLPGYSASGWYGLVAPAATPKDALAKLNAAAIKALRAPDVAERLASQGAEAVGNSAEEWGAFIRSEIDKWARVVKAANMKAD